MKEKWKLLLKWAGVFIFCFVIIYLTVFFWGSKLFGSGDPILIEIGVALILSIFVFAFVEAVSVLEKRVKALEERLNAFENKQ